jgi:mannose-6-phosphate isomerase-like protein (cupin superfamily)
MMWFKNKQIRTAAVLAGLLLALAPAAAAEREIDPSFLYRDSNTAPEKPSDVTTATCHYHPLFGAGEKQTPVLGSVARYGIVDIDPHGSCTSVQYPDEEQLYVVLKGDGEATYAAEKVPLKTEDFLYLPATVQHGLVNMAAVPMKVVIMGFHTKGFPSGPLPAHPLKDNIENVPIEHVGGHPDSSHFRLLTGDAPQTRNRFNVGYVVTSLFLMEIDPSGTNFPHHHPDMEEIYLILDGHGQQVAGGGADGIAGLHPAKPGDAYFYRMNTTVGYYSAPGVKSRILCVRSFDPGKSPGSPKAK